MGQQLPTPSVYHTFGVRPVINACGIFTDLGGSLLSPEIFNAWQELNLHWVDMPELLTRTGEWIATLLEVPAARVTASASSAIALAIGACIVGEDRQKGDQLPHAEGVPREVVFQTAHLNEYKYSVCVRLGGGTLLGAGSDTRTTETQLEAAISPRTAAIFIPVHLDGCEGTLRLEQVAEVAKRHRVPLVVDAAYMNFPLEPDPTLPEFATAAKDTMMSFSRRGADLVCFSAKYFWGPNAGGFVCGRRDLVAQVAALDFTGFETGIHRPFGRAFKMGRYEVVAVALALRAWLELDHRERLQRYARQVVRLAGALDDLAGVRTHAAYFTLDERWVTPGASSVVNSLVIDIGPEAAKSLTVVARELASRTPAIVPYVANNQMTVVMESVPEGTELVIGEALRSILTARP